MKSKSEPAQSLESKHKDSAESTTPVNYLGPARNWNSLSYTLISQCLAFFCCCYSLLAFSISFDPAREIVFNKLIDSLHMKSRNFRNHMWRFFPLFGARHCPIIWRAIIAH
jgi:hypothetical protein